MPPIRKYSLQTDRARIEVLATTVVGSDSVEAIRSAIAEGRPDVVLVDYDESRWQWLADPAFREQANLVDIIRKKELAVLNARLAMGIFRKFVSPPSGEVAEDEDVRAAVETARSLGIEVVFVRRPVEIEGVRAWRLSPLGARARLFVALVVGSLRPTGVKEAKTAAAREAFDPEVRRRDVERRAGAVAARVVFEESERWTGARLGEVTGDALLLTREIHVAGIAAALESGGDVADLCRIPEKSLLARAVPWLFSAAIVTAFVLGFVFGDFDKMRDALVAWVVANAVLAGLGAAAAGGHPWTIIATGLSAPFVSLNPAVGAGMVGAFVQALAAPPSVRDMDKVGDDITSWRGWWRNRLARILLVFVFANIASTIGSFVALAWLP